MSQPGPDDSPTMPSPMVLPGTIAPPTVRTIMSTRTVTVTMDDSLARARELFNEHHFHHLLVVQGPTLLGIISDRDLLKAVSPNIGKLSETDRDRATLNKRAHQIMSRTLITVTADTTVEAAARLLLEHRLLRGLVFVFALSAAVVIAWQGRGWTAGLAAVLPGGSDAVGWSAAAALCVLANWGFAALRGQFGRGPRTSA